MPRGRHPCLHQAIRLPESAECLWESAGRTSLVFRASLAHRNTKGAYGSPSVRTKLRPRKRVALCEIGGIGSPWADQGTDVLKRSPRSSPSSGVIGVRGSGDWFPSRPNRSIGRTLRCVRTLSQDGVSGRNSGCNSDLERHEGIRHGVIHIRLLPNDLDKSIIADRLAWSLAFAPRRVVWEHPNCLGGTVPGKSRNDYHPMIITPSRRVGG